MIIILAVRTTKLLAKMREVLGICLNVGVLKRTTGSTGRPTVQSHRDGLGFALPLLSPLLAL